MLTKIPPRCRIRLPLSPWYPCLEVKSQSWHLKVCSRSARWRDLWARQLFSLEVRYGQRLHCIVCSLVSGEVKLEEEGRDFNFATLVFSLGFLHCDIGIAVQVVLLPFILHDYVIRSVFCMVRVLQGKFA